jgi:hypothetical protein
MSAIKVERRSLFVCICPNSPSKEFLIYSVSEKLSDQVRFTRVIYSKPEKHKREGN